MSDFERAPASLSRFHGGLQDTAELRHVAYCSGPAQLVYFLSALQMRGISPQDCTVFPFTATAKNDEVRTTLLKMCGHIGIQIVDTFGLPSSSLYRVLLPFRDPKRAKYTAFWYCRGGIEPRFPLDHLMKILANIVYEYYDGFRSPVVVLEQKRRNLSLNSATCVADLRQLAIERLLRAARYFMPDDGLWAKCAPPGVARLTDYIPLNIIRDNISLVGHILDEIDGGEKTYQDYPCVVLIIGMFSERLTFVSLADELDLYNDILAIVRAVSQTASILVKPHPKTSTEKMQGLKDMCARHNAVLHTRQQLLEYMLEQSGQRDVAVIGPPSTALLSTIHFGYGNAFCPSQQFTASYNGRTYANNHWMTMDHELMEIAGVNTFDSLQELRDLLEQKRAP